MAAIEDIQRSFSRSLDQLQDLATALDDEIERIREEVIRRRDALAARAETEAARLRQSLEHEISGAVEIATNLGRDASRRVGERVSEALAGLDIASASEVQKLGRKLDRISKRVRALEKSEPE